MVYGEKKHELRRNAKFRNFTMGNKKVKEREEYNHVGVKNCLFGNSFARTEDRISWGRRAFNWILSIGIKTKGVSTAVCYIIFWSIIAPIIIYGSELWILGPEEVELLSKFQRYVGQRCQRFPLRSPNFSSVCPIGWISIERFIQVNKMLFLRTLMVMPDESIVKQVLVDRVNMYQNDTERYTRNEINSLVFELLNTCKMFGNFYICVAVINGGCYFSKDEWKKKIWEIAWVKEDEDYKFTCQTTFMYKVIDKPYFLIWGILSDLVPVIIGDLEIMAKLVCNSSLLKDHDYRLKKLSFSHKVCTECPLGIREDLLHSVMQCPDTQEIRTVMFALINAIDDVYVKDVIAEQQDLFYIIIGKHPAGIPFESVSNILLVSSWYISKIYRRLNDRRRLP